jgi:hypothetical protein
VCLLLLGSCRGISRSSRTNASYAGGLSGAAALIAAGHLLEAFLCALAASACVLLLTGAVTVSEIIKVKVSRTFAHYDQPHNGLQCHKCTDQRSLHHRI